MLVILRPMLVRLFLWLVFWIHILHVLLSKIYQKKNIDQLEL